MTGERVRIIDGGSIWHVVGVIDGLATLRHPTERHNCPGHRLHGKPGEVFAPYAQLIPVDSRTLSTGAPGEVAARSEAVQPAPGAEPAPTEATDRETVVRPSSAPPSVGAATVGHRGARNTDPDTSLEAAESITDEARRHVYDQIIRIIFEHGPQTDWQLGQKLGLLATSAGKRRGELRDMGLVEQTEFRGPTSTGPKRAWRYGLTAAGEREAAA